MFLWGPQQIDRQVVRSVSSLVPSRMVSLELIWIKRVNKTSRQTRLWQAFDMKFSAQVMKVWQRFQQVLASGQSYSTKSESHVWLLEWPHSILQPKKVRWDSDMKGIKSLKPAEVVILGSKAGGDAGDRAEHCIHQLGHHRAWGSWPLQQWDSPRGSWADALHLSPFISCDGFLGVEVVYN